MECPVLEESKIDGVSENQDSLRQKFLFARSNNSPKLPVHPIQAIQNNWANDQKELKYFGLANTFGSHMSFRLQMEEAILTHHQKQRFPQLSPSSVALETFFGDDEFITIEDYLNLPENSEEFELNPLHTYMEQQFFPS